MSTPLQLSTPLRFRDSPLLSQDNILITANKTNPYHGKGDNYPNFPNPTDFIERIMKNIPDNKDDFMKEWNKFSELDKSNYISWFYTTRKISLKDFMLHNGTPSTSFIRFNTGFINYLSSLQLRDNDPVWYYSIPSHIITGYGGYGGSHRRRPRSLSKSSRKSKKSSKRVFRKKSRLTRRR